MKNKAKSPAPAKKTATKKAAPSKAPTPTPKSKPTPTGKPVEKPVEPTAITTTPLPPPPAPEVPQETTLVREGEKGKRYVSKTDPDSKYHLRARSTATKPCHIVREIFCENPQAERKAVIALCLEAGVDKNTASTQYSLCKSGKVKMPIAVASAPGRAPTPDEGEEEDVMVVEDDE